MNSHTLNKIHEEICGICNVEHCYIDTDNTPDYKVCPYLSKITNLINSNNNITPSVKNLLNSNMLVVFDLDGTLGIYEMGKRYHAAVENSQWQNYLRKVHPYDTMRPIPQMQMFIKDKGLDKIYVCSIAHTKEEEAQKMDFVKREYNIPESHIRFVRSSDEKVDYMKELAFVNGIMPYDIAMVEDTVQTLDKILERTDCCTVHVSSFFTYTSQT